jgi:hypothetical protein
MQSANDSGNAVFTRTDHMGDNPRRIGLELVRAVGKMTDNALNVDTRWFYYYKRKSVGRVCTCCSGEHNAPNAKCVICYGTGIVGGFDKYGTRSETIDFSFDNFTTMNVTTKADSLPVSFVLEDGAKYGTITCFLNIHKNQKVIDSFFVTSKGNVQVSFRREGEAVWKEASKDQLAKDLDPGRIEFMITMRRDHASHPSPIFLKLYLRYAVLPQSEMMIRGDIPTNTETVSLQEYGMDEQLGTIQLVMGSAGQKKLVQLTTFTIEDFVYYIEKGKYWKFTEVKPNFALGFYSSFDITARYVQSYEMYRRFPI